MHKRECMKKELPQYKGGWLHFFPEDPGALSCLGQVYALAGNKDKSYKILEKVLEKVEQGHFQNYHAPLFIAQLYGGIGEMDKALEWLDRAYEDRVPGLGLVIRALSWPENLRSNPRFTALVERFGFPD